VNQTPNNPAGNKLGAGIDEPALIRAIETSGYPLQGVVADKLKSTFGVTEEWGYIDRDTQEHRSLDVFAFRKLATDGEVQPCVVLLVECKRSRHPYVFFQNVVDRKIPGFPQVAGLIRITVKDSNKRRFMPAGPEILGLDDLPFVRPGPPHCSAFTKAIAEGKKVTVSGTDAFNSLILPLVKAMDHAASLYQAPTSPLQPTLILCLSVIDAPVLVVTSPREASAPLFTPWVRVPRQEAHPEHHRINQKYYVVDLVHIDFFDAFLSDHLTPFLEEFASRLKKQSKILIKGGTVQNLDSWRWDEIIANP
jgi:hypothetical protein